MDHPTVTIGPVGVGQVLDFDSQRYRPFHLLYLYGSVTFLLY
jgi:hypothetical protein